MSSPGFDSHPVTVDSSPGFDSHPVTPSPHEAQEQELPLSEVGPSPG
jgi:hypothetical protein